MKPLVRCLHCKKPLPLLKRLSGAEFCSDSHRQQYKAEYNQLAINRLAAAKKSDDEPRNAPDLTALQKPVGAAVEEEPAKPAPLPPPPPVKTMPDKRGAPSARPNGAKGTAKPPFPPGVMRPGMNPPARRLPPAAATAAKASIAGDTTPAPPVTKTSEPAPARDAASTAPIPALSEPVPPSGAQERLPEREPSVTIQDSNRTVVSEASAQPVEQSVSEPIAPPPRDGAAEGVPMANPLVSIRKPHPAARKFRTLSAGQIDPKPSAVVFPPQLPASAIALLAAPTFALSLQPLEVEPELRSKDAWTEAREFQRTHHKPEPLGYEALFPAAKRRTEPVPVPVPAFPWTTPPQRERYMVPFAPFPASVVQLHLVLHELDLCKSAGTEIADVRDPENPSDPAKPTVLDATPANESTVAALISEATPEPVDSTDHYRAPKFVSATARFSIDPILPERVHPVHLDAVALDSAFGPVLPANDSLPLRPVMFIRPKRRSPEPETVLKAATETLREELKPAEVATPAIALPSTASPVFKFVDDVPAPRSSTITTTPAPPEPAVVASNAAEVPSVPAPRVVTVTSADPTLKTRLKQNDLDLPQLDLAPAKKADTSSILKIGGIVLAVLAIAGAAFYLFPDKAEVPAAALVTTSAPGTAENWRLDFSPDSKHPRTISLLRASEGLRDYRVEFDGVTDIGGLGWVFRAKDAKNFYVTRIEPRRQDGQQGLTVIHYAVVDGIGQPRVLKPVTGIISDNGTWHVRFEAAGSRFTTWIQDMRVDDWTDARLASGGAGLFAESGERALLRGEFRVSPFTKN